MLYPHYCCINYCRNSSFMASQCQLSTLSSANFPHFIQSMVLVFSARLLEPLQNGIHLNIFKYTTEVVVLILHDGFGIVINKFSN